MMPPRRRASFKSWSVLIGPAIDILRFYQSPGLKEEALDALIKYAEAMLWGVRFLDKITLIPHVPREED